MAFAPSDQDPYWVTINQAANVARCHANTIRNLISSGQLPASRIGSRIIRIDKKDLDALFTPVVGGEFGVWSR
jgi:excisionase family DNA binding protein